MMFKDENVAKFWNENVMNCVTLNDQYNGCVTMHIALYIISVYVSMHIWIHVYVCVDIYVYKYDTLG
jgi:hypothetical protein